MEINIIVNYHSSGSGPNHWVQHPRPNDLRSKLAQTTPNWANLQLWPISCKPVLEQILEKRTSCTQILKPGTMSLNQDV